MRPFAPLQSGLVGPETLPLLLLVSGLGLAIAEALAPGAHFIVLGLALLGAGAVGVVGTSLGLPVLASPFVLAFLVLLFGALSFYGYRNVGLGDGGGERTIDHVALSTVLDGFEPGDEVEVVGYVDGERTVWDVTLGEQDGEAFLGVTGQRGVTGMTVDDFGTDPYPAAQFLGILGGGDGAGIDSPIQRAVVTLSLPFLSATGGSAYSFAGFNGAVTNFFVATGPLAALGTGAVLLIANVLYWMAWINLIIGQFNCVPAYPLDGGHLLRTSTEAIVSRLPVPDGRAVTSAVTTTITLAMLGGLFVVIFGPRLLT